MKRPANSHCTEILDWSGNTGEREPAQPAPALGHPMGLVTTVGPMARTAKDLRLLFAALAGYDSEDPFSVPIPLREPRLRALRIGVCERFYDVPIQEEIGRAVWS